MRIDKLKQILLQTQQRWLVTGAAGFIGSNLVEFLLEANQIVIGVDNFSTGKQSNLDDLLEIVGSKKENFTFIKGDILNEKLCLELTSKVDYVLHQAALGSVPRSVEDPLATNSSNVTGFLNLIYSAMKNEVKGFVYASSSSVYGDSRELPKVEINKGKPLSPYAVSKAVNEDYAHSFKSVYDFSSVGLRYFNVFGKRQDPDGAYAAVIPKWIKQFVEGESITINGDGENSRDFCYVKNVIQANILSAMHCQELGTASIFNVACGEQTTLNELSHVLKREINTCIPSLKLKDTIYQNERVGDIKHSLADIRVINKSVGYEPEYSILEGLRDSLKWYIQNLYGA